VLKLNVEELKQQLHNLISVPDLLFAEVLENIQQPSNLKYKELVEASIRAVDQADGKDQRRSYEEKRLKAQTTYDQICVFEDGIVDLSGNRILCLIYKLNNFRVFGSASLFASFSGC
jgi:hypothetical protein